MKILVVSTAIFPCPPPGYGGLELVVFELARALAKRGHEVTLNAIKGSKADGFEVASPCDGGPHNPEGELFNPLIPRIKDHGFDAILDHSWLGLSWSLKKDCPWLPVIHTCHGMLPYSSMPPEVNKPCLVGVSRWHANFLHWQYNVPVEYAYNGSDISGLPLVEEKEPYAIFLARITQGKGAIEAITIMREWIKRGYIDYGIIAGEDQFVDTQGYVVAVQQRCDGRDIIYMGTTPLEMKIDLLSHARVMISPLMPPYAEIFGLATVEALACGTPVISVDSGAAREIITPETGIIVHEWSDAIDKYPLLVKISPRDCRLRAEEFSPDNMAGRYEELAERAISNGGW